MKASRFSGVQKAFVLEQCEEGVVLHGSPRIRNAPYPRRNSNGAFETGATSFGHPVQHADTNLGLRFLVLKAARL